MRLLDGLATLSESGSHLPTKPHHQEDIYDLSAKSVAPVQQAQPAAATGWGSTSMPQSASTESVDYAVNQAFPFTAIRDSLLGAATNVSPGECRRQCLSIPQCAAWEVCAP